MKRCFMIMILSLFLFTITQAQETIPDNDIIIKLAELTKEDNVEKTFPIILKDGEKAFIALINRFRGRNNMSGLYLVRPALKKVQEIQGSVQEVYGVPATSGTSELVVIQDGASGQGDEFYGKSLMYFKGWSPVVLHKIKYGKSDACVNFPSLGSPCYSHQVEWEFKNTEKDLLLIETSIYEDDTSKGATKTVKTYRIKNHSLSLLNSKKSKVY